MKSHWLIAAGAVAALALAGPAARADGWHGDWHGGPGWHGGDWHGGPGWHGGPWWGGPYWRGPVVGFGITVAPPVVYAPAPVVAYPYPLPLPPPPPPAVIFAPPPIAYIPPPVFVAPAGLSIGVNIPLR